MAVSLGPILSGHMLNLDPPDHERLRRLVSKEAAAVVSSTSNPAEVEGSAEKVAAHETTVRFTIEPAEIGGVTIPPGQVVLVARMEAAIAFGALLDRFPSMTLAAPPTSLRWRFSALIRGLEALPVRLAT